MFHKQFKRIKKLILNEGINQNHLYKTASGIPTIQDEFILNYISISIYWIFQDTIRRKVLAVLLVSTHPAVNCPLVPEGRSAL